MNFPEAGPASTASSPSQILFYALTASDLAVKYPVLYLDVLYLDVLYLDVLYLDPGTMMTAPP
jgi:hypothetical protein